MRRGAASVALHAALLAGGVLVLTPMAWMLAASFMAPGEANNYPPRFVPHAATLEQYRALFIRLDLGRYLLNSAIVSTAATAISVVVNSMAGYALTKLRFRARERVFRSLSLGLLVPTQVAMLPLFLLFKQLGLVNTYWGVIVPSMASIFGIFLIRQYLLTLPDDLLDAARIDGASEFRIYRSIVLPLITPILATLAIWTFLNTWNDFQWPLVILSDSERYTLPVALANLAGEHVQDTELMMAGAVVTVLPVMLVFVLLQRYYIRGMTAGGVKG
ncbi:MAG: carbohydrate ABC transporter permease [Gemmatimonadales bacterium]|nr:carbohydrate ABC transporter permease [Gemmatimonadales bacterium]